MEMIPNSFFIPTNFAVKASVLKIVEVSYDKKGLDMKLMAKKGKFKATLDSEGNVTVKTSINKFSLNGDPALKALGAEFKSMKIEFSVAENGDLKYLVGVKCFKVAEFSVDGQFDFEEFLLNRGLLKGAYDALKNREQQLEDALNESLY